MAVQYPTFGKLHEADFSGLSNLVDNVYKGYEYSKLPAKLREEQAILEMKRALGWKKDAREEAKEARLSEAAKRKQDLLSLILGQNGDTATGASAPQASPPGQNGQSSWATPSVTSTGKTTPSDFEGLPHGTSDYGYIASPEDLAQGANARFNPAQAAPPGLARSPSDTPADFAPVKDEHPEPGVNVGEDMKTKPQKPKMTYGQYVVAAKEVGLPAPKIIEVDGEHVAVTPIGNLPVAHGQSPEDLARSKALGTHAGKFSGEIDDKRLDLDQHSDTLDRIQNIVSKYPNPENVIGPLNSWATKVGGNEEERKFMGEVAAESGNITLGAASSIKGAFTGRDMGLINSIKPNLSDTYPVFQGKLKALRLADAVISKKYDVIQRELARGATPSQAMAMARKEVNMSEVEKTMEGLKEKPSKNKAENSGDMVTVSKWGRTFRIPRSQLEDFKNA